MADVNYVIDIAANMPGGSQTLAELDALTSSLQGAGRKSDSFQQALKIVTQQLDAAKVASAAANAQLTAGADHYSALEREALRASKALEKAALKGVVPPEIAAQADRSNAALKSYESTLRKLEGESALATGAQKKLEQQLSNVDKVMKHVDDRNSRAIQRYSKLAEASAVLPGPLGRWIGVAARSAKANAELTATFGAAQARMLIFAAGAVIAATALTVLTVAVVAGFAAWSAYAASTADAARSAGLAREAFAALSPETAAAVSAFDDIAAATGLTDTELTNLTKQLKAAKVAAGDMPSALYAAATAEAALGAGGAAEFIRQIQEGEKSVESFARESQAAFGGIVAEKLRGLTAQGKKLSKNFAGLFAGINLEPVLDAVAIFVGMFDKANPLAQAFSAGIEKAFGVVADNAVSAAYAIEAFALDVAIASLKAYIFFKQNSDKIEGALIALGVAVGVAGVAWAVFNGAVIAGWIASAGAAVASAATIAAAWLVAAAPALVFIAAIAAVGAAIYQLVVYWDDVVEGVKLIWSDIVEWFAGIDMAQIGRDLLLGLASGITGAATAVIDAVTGAVGSAVTAAKDVLGIASPSKVFAEIGGQTAEGYSQGVEQGTPQAQGSMSSMVAPDGAAATAQAGASSGRGGASIDLAGATFNFYGVANAETARDRMAEMFTALLEGDADMLSGAQTT
jgi:hypothetical protein